MTIVLCSVCWYVTLDMKVKYSNITHNSVVIDGLYPLYLMYLHDKRMSPLEMNYT